MTDREQLNEMQQFMDIANGKLPNQDVITEAVTGGMIEVGGQEYPWRRVPIEVYDQFKAEYPGSNIRFRGPRRGRDNTSKADATHFYVVRQGPNNPKPEDMARIHQPERQQELEFGPKNRPHTPGYNKLEPASRAAADSRAQAFIFDNVNDDELYYGAEEEAAYDDLKTKIPREQILAWMEDYELVDSTAKIDDAVYDWFITKYIDDGVENFDGEQWHNWLADFVADNRAITEEAGINLESIVESVLTEFPGAPKDYVDPEDRVDEPKPEPEDIVTDYGSDIEDEELGLRFD